MAKNMKVNVGCFFFFFVQAEKSKPEDETDGLPVLKTNVVENADEVITRRKKEDRTVTMTNEQVIKALGNVFTFFFFHFFFYKLKYFFTNLGILLILFSY